MGLRDYGMGPSGTPIGSPEWKKAETINGSDPICPNCGSWLCEIMVLVSHPLLKGGMGSSRYLGCPACPYASPAMIRAIQPVNYEEA